MSDLMPRRFNTRRGFFSPFPTTGGVEGFIHQAQYSRTLRIAGVCWKCNTMRMRKLSEKDIKEINRFRSILPAEVSVSVRAAEEGGFICELKTFPRCFTQGDNFYELIRMINDLIYTYLDIPLKYLPYMPSYNPPLTMARDLAGFPALRKKNLQLKLLNRERAAI